MERIYRIGIRTSRLALKQAEEILSNFNGLCYELAAIETYGDKDKNIPISEIEGSDFFTREIDETLLAGKIDLAVHSAKDLPDKLMPGLSIAAITKSIDPFDALVSKNNLKLNELKNRAAVGTSSRRRKEAIKKYRNDLQIIDIRGNIEERLKLLYETDLDAIVIAAAGLIRLGQEYRIAHRIPSEILKPHPMQGKLAVVVREDDENIIRLCRKCLPQPDG